jgi:hypothetical protein
VRLSTRPHCLSCLPCPACSYAAKYLTQALASFETAGVTPPDAGLNLTGVNQTGRWLIDSLGTSSGFFDWADGSVTPDASIYANLM